jgi:hypothetical protein
MSAWPGLSGRLAVWWLALLACFSATACSSPDEATPEPSRSPLLNTIEASEVGDRLTVTASVTDVLPGRSFVVRDVDLPDDGLLVLGEAQVRAPALVTAEGVIERFTFDRFRDRYELADAAAFLRFEDRKFLLAEDIRSWANMGLPPAAQ